MKITHSILWLLRIILVAFIALQANPANAAVEVNVATMVENFNDALPSIMRLVTAIAYVMGMFFIIKGVMMLKDVGESRSALHGDRGLLKGGLIMLFVGAALLYLPSSVQTGMSTFWANPTPLAYVAQQNDPWSELIKACFMIIQLIGTIAFIRGLIMLSYLGQQGGHQGVFGKAMAHIIGGILLIDMYDFVMAVINTLGLGKV